MILHSCLLCFYGIIVLVIATILFDQKSGTDSVESTMAHQRRITRWTQCLFSCVEKWIDSLHVTPKRKRKHKLSACQTQSRGQSSNTLIRMVAMVAMVAMESSPLNVQQATPFDTDSRRVGIDNRCSVCITHKRFDIPWEITPCNRAIKGFGGT